MLNYNELKKKSVVNVLDGRKLGKIKDVIFTFPEGKITAFVVGEQRFLFAQDDYKINLCCINKIGDDTVLVSLAEPKTAVKCEDDE